jgi:molecular chaperone DnaK (HSP70)
MISIVFKYTLNNRPGNDRESKTPTLLLYNNDKHTIDEKKWGIKARQSKNKHQALLECFKLLIAPQIIKDYYGPGNIAFEKIRNDARFNKLTVKAMIVDYIKKLNTAALKHIKDKERASVWKIFQEKPKVKYILTVPCMWSEVAKTTMREAAVLAGLAATEDDVTLITEPEAAALFFDDKIQKLDPTETYFIVCDAGGGTVDLVTYAAGKVDDDKQASIKQVGEGCGDLCGSNRINRLFSEYLKHCFPAEFVRKEEFFEFIAENFEKEKVIQLQIYKIKLLICVL